MRVSSSALVSVVAALCCLSFLPSVRGAFWNVYGDAICATAAMTDPFLTYAVDTPPFNGTCTLYSATPGTGNSYTFLYKSSAGLTTALYSLYNGTVCAPSLLFANVSVAAAFPVITCEESLLILNGTNTTFYSSIGFGASSSSSSSSSSTGSSSSSVGPAGNHSSSSSSSAEGASAGNYSSSSSSTGAGPDDEGMSTTMLAVIGGAIVVAIIVAIIAAYYGYRAYKQRQQRQRLPDDQQGTGSYGALSE